MKREEVVEFFSKFWKIDKSKIADSMKLDSTTLKGNVSIKLYQFFAEVEEKFNVNLSDVNEITTFGDIMKKIS